MLACDAPLVDLAWEYLDLEALALPPPSSPAPPPPYPVSPSRAGRLKLTSRLAYVLASVSPSAQPTAESSGPVAGLAPGPLRLAVVLLLLLPPPPQPWLPKCICSSQERSMSSELFADCVPFFFRMGFTAGLLRDFASLVGAVCPQSAYDAIILESGSRQEPGRSTAGFLLRPETSFPLCLLPVGTVAWVGVVDARVMSVR